MSPKVRSKSINLLEIRDEAQEDELEISHMIEEEKEKGHYDNVQNLRADLVYNRAKAEVKMDSTMLSERMNPDMLANIDDIVTYHWNKRKREIMHQRMVNTMDPVDSTNQEEIEYQLERRKKAMVEGAAFYEALDNEGTAMGTPSGYYVERQQLDTSKLLGNLTSSQSVDVSHILEAAHKRRGDLSQNDIQQE